MRVVTNGLQREGSGIGVVQRHLYPLLKARGLDVYEMPSREPSKTGLGGRISGLMRGWTAPRLDYEVFLSVVPPMASGLKRPLVTIINDLRWQRTRSGIFRYYRAWDLRRTVKGSVVLICISSRTRLDLESFAPSAKGRTVVALLGPGIMPPDSFSDQANGRVLLIGGAAHKRNEHAARVLAARPSWVEQVVGVGVSDEVKGIVDEAYPGRTKWLGRISDTQLIEEYRGAEYFLFLGMEEGFGLPYIEALSAGCKVIAVDQPLTRELLGTSAVLVDDGSAESVAAQLDSVDSPSAEIRRDWAAKFTWEGFADVVYAQLKRTVTS